MIPKLLHFVWVGEAAVPKFVHRHLQLWQELNPEHTIWFHRSDCLLAADLRERYEAAKYPQSKADILRYSLLRSHGGWAIDVDFYPLRPIEDAERGFCLSDDRVFVSKQAGNRGGDSAPYANGIMASSPYSAGIKAICERVKITACSCFCSFGPFLVQQSLAANPEFFTVGEAGWFFPIAHSQTEAAYPHLVAGNPHRLNLRTAATAGQMPIAAHLWGSIQDLDQYAESKHADSPLAVILHHERRDHWLSRLGEGLRGLGWQTLDFDKYHREGRIVAPDLFVCWNDKRPKKLIQAAKDAERPILFLEHGFWNRGKFVQVDPKGLLHRASWADDVGSHDPPPGAAERLAEHVSNIEPQRAREWVYPSPWPDRRRHPAGRVRNKRTGPAATLRQAVRAPRR